MLFCLLRLYILFDNAIVKRFALSIFYLTFVRLLIFQFGRAITGVSRSCNHTKDQASDSSDNTALYFRKNPSSHGIETLSRYSFVSDVEETKIFVRFRCWGNQDIRLFQMLRKPEDGEVGLQWGLRPVLAGEERNRSGSAPAKQHGSILAANKVSVQRNLGPVIGAPGTSVLADSFSGTVSQILNNAS